MIPDFIIKNASPIIETRIKEIIQGVASELKLDAVKLDTMLKIAYNQLNIYVFYDKKRVKEFPLNEVKGSISSVIETHIKGIFERDALLYGVNTAYVNYVFRLYPDGNLFVWPNIAGEYKERMTLKQIL